MKRGGVAALRGWAVHMPGVDLSTILEQFDHTPVCSSAEAAEILGRKHLLGKDAATRLALCAATLALRATQPLERDASRDVATAVVVSSNLGNIETVQRIARALRHEGLRGVSALDAPNASSNVIASTVAIWFRFGGPNLMICSGATAGLDAVATACLLLRSGRAERVVVVGVESDDEAAAALYSQSTPVGHKLRPAAAALVLERLTVGTGPGPQLSLQASLSEPIRAVHGNTIELHSSETPGAPPSQIIELQHILGDSYGASGVLQVAVAAQIMHASQPRRPMRAATLTCGSRLDGWRRAQLTYQSSHE